MKRFSLTRRLIAAVIASQIALAAGLVAVGSYYTRYHLLAAFDVNLEGRALSVAALTYYSKEGKSQLLFDGSRIPPSPHDIHKDFFLVRSEDGSFERHSAGFNPNLFNNIPKEARHWSFESKGEPYRAVILRDMPVLGTNANVQQPPSKLTVVYGAPTMDISQRIGGLAAVFALASLVLLVPTLVFAVWSIRRTLNPLARLAYEARSISVQNWSFQPPEEAKSVTELSPLIAAIDTVLAGLQRAFTRQREFLGDAAHELKTSLAILKSSWQSLLTKPRTAAEYRAGLARMSEDGDRLEELLDRMLRLARVEQWAADGGQPAWERVELASTCEMAVARITRLAATRHVELHFAASDSAFVKADPADLELVWSNLLENAVHASSAGSSVRITLQNEGDHACVTVSDSGCGIAEDELPHIFERFRRGDPSRSRATGGFGLGLAIVHSIVQAYKGSITVKSELGEGTHMIVCLPLGTSEEKAEPSREATESVA